jgi:pimeloyl-ACP methyl ester carboxylesterase
MVNTNIETNLKELEKPIMLFIPPFGADIYFYNFFYIYFTKQYRIIAYDQRGHGGSEHHKNDNYKFSEYINDLNSFLDIKIQDNTNQQPLTILISSFTGLMVLHNLSKINFHSSKVNIIILSSSDRIQESLQQLLKKLPHPRTWPVIKRSGRNKAKKMLFLPETDNEIKDFVLDNLFKTDNRVVFETLKNLTSRSYINGIKKKDLFRFNKKLRFLVINAENDIIFPLKDNQHLVELLPNTTRYVLKGNHFFMLENPLESIKIIVNWLEADK